MQGILKKWYGAYGIIYCPQARRYFLHKKQIVEGTPEIGRVVTFDVGPARSATELEQALNVRIGETAGAR